MGELDLVQDLAVVTFFAGLGGFLCQKIGLSSIVGFLLAGLVIGPHTPPFSIVMHEDRIEALSQLGLVFLMFSIGLDLSVGKLRRMGLGIVLAVALGAILVFNIVRLLCPFLGVSSTESLFVAGMLVASSSAIIGKILPETGLIHQRAGNLAMSITVLEDLVAVVALTFISSVAQMHTGLGGEHREDSRYFASLCHRGGRTRFVAASQIVATFKPSRHGSAHHHRRWTGPRRRSYCGQDRVFVGLGSFSPWSDCRRNAAAPHCRARNARDARCLYCSLLRLDRNAAQSRTSPQELDFDLSLGILTILVRTFALSVSLLVTGTSDRDAFRAALMVTPIGEFAFIIAQLGVSARLLSSDYYPITVGVALFTALVSPFLIRHSGPISDGWLKAQPKFFYNLLELYQQLLASVGEHQRRSKVFGLARRSLPPLVISVILASGILIVAPFLFGRWSLLFPTTAGDWSSHLFWAIIGVAAAGPLLGVWRRLAEFFKGTVEIAFGSQRPILLICLDLVAALLLLDWIWLLTPLIGAYPSFLGAILVTAAVYALFFGRRMQSVQGRIASELAEAILSPEERRKRSHDDWLKDHQEWDLNLSEIQVPDSEAWFGKSLGDLSLRSQFGCSVVGVDRQGYPVPSPGPDTELFPGDGLLVLGTATQIRHVRAFFDSSPCQDRESRFVGRDPAGVYRGDREKPPCWQCVGRARDSAANGRPDRRRGPRGLSDAVPGSFSGP